MKEKAGDVVLGHPDYQLIKAQFDKIEAPKTMKQNCSFCFT